MGRVLPLGWLPFPSKVNLTDLGRIYTAWRQTLREVIGPISISSKAALCGLQLSPCMSWRLNGLKSPWFHQTKMVLSLNLKDLKIIKIVICNPFYMPRDVKGAVPRAGTAGREVGPARPTRMVRHGLCLFCVWAVPCLRAHCASCSGLLFIFGLTLPSQSSLYFRSFT